MSKKNPEKFQQKQIKDKEMKRKKEIRKRQEKLHTFISIMYYSDQVYLHYYALTFGAQCCRAYKLQIFAKKFDKVR